MRKLISCLCVLLLALTVSGCHGSKGMHAFVIPEDFDETKKYEITFWAKNDTNKTQTQIYEKAIRDFEKLYPNITVNMRLYTDYGRIYNDVITNISTNTTPNVCITYPDHIATYITGQNIVVPLDELFADEQYGFGGSALKYDGPARDEVIPKFLDECIVSDQHYAIPYMRSTEALYINKTFVEKLGYEIPEILTWDLIFEIAQAATEKDADGTYVLNGQKVMLPFIYKSTDNMMIQMLKQRGAGYSQPDGTVEIFNDTTKEILHMVADNVRTDAFSTFKISGYPGNFFNAGQCIFAVDSTAGATWMGSDAPLMDIPAERVVPFETEVRMIPQYDPEHPQMISQGPSICIFNKADSQEVLASWLFAQYLLTNEVQTAYAETEGYIPVTSKAQQSNAYQEYLALSGSDQKEHYHVKIAASRLLLENIENTFVTPVFNGSTSLRDAAGQMIEDTAKSIRRKQTVDEAYIDKEFDNVTALYRLDQKADTGSLEEEDLGPLPATAKALLGVLVLTWIMILLYVGREQLKKRAQN